MSLPAVVINLHGGPADGAKIEKLALPGDVFPETYKADGVIWAAYYRMSRFDTATGEWRADYTKRCEAVL